MGRRSTIRNSSVDSDQHNVGRTSVVIGRDGFSLRSFKSVGMPPLIEVLLYCTSIRNFCLFYFPTIIWFNTLYLK